MLVFLEIMLRICSVGIILVALFGIPIMLIITLFEYDRRFPIIDFKSFKKFYVLNPDRWYCNESYVQCWIGTCDYEKFSFGLLDFYKYRRWLKIQLKNKSKEKHNKSKQRMMDAVKQDIAASEAEAKRMHEKLLADLRQQCDTSDDILFDIMKLVEEYKEKIW